MSSVAKPITPALAETIAGVMNEAVKKFSGNGTHVRAGVDIAAHASLDALTQ